MTATRRAERAARAGRFAAAALLLAATAAVLAGVEHRSRDARTAVGPVLPEFAERAGEAARIMIVSPEARYEIQRTPKGWALKDRGNFPVRREKLAQLTRGLQSLAFLRPMTRDPDKHERLGLGDPRQGGSGLLIQVEDGQGARLADLVFSAQPGGAQFVRKLSDPQTWAVKGDLPALRNVAEWLDLIPYEMSRDRIARIEVAPAQGPAYAIARTAPELGLALVPANPAAASSRVEATGAALAQLSPNDVRPAAAVPGPPSARVRLTTFDGLGIEAELFVEGPRRWIKFIARADEPTASEEATRINLRAAPWAFGLDAFQHETVAPPLASLLIAPSN